MGNSADGKRLAQTKESPAGYLKPVYGLTTEVEGSSSSSLCPWQDVLPSQDLNQACQSATVYFASSSFHPTRDCSWSTPPIWLAITGPPVDRRRLHFLLSRVLHSVSPSGAMWLKYRTYTWLMCFRSHDMTSSSSSLLQSP